MDWKYGVDVKPGFDYRSPEKSISMGTDAKSKSWWGGNKNFTGFVCMQGGCEGIGGKKRSERERDST